ncbi:MAG: 2-oxo acid dehydrogenase subunit E2 [Deltaproteobacteria bacterium]|nr:2-oxo acid dehydrogenase subunit E2 [Deltaproteobacteria bacterium]
MISGAQTIDPDKYGPVERQPFQGVRKSIAARLLKTTTSTPLVTHFDFTDVSAVDAVRKANKLTYMPFFIKAVTEALKEYPRINSQLDEEKGEIVYLKYYNIGIAVDTPAGLMVPVIKDADKKSLAEISQALTDISERARSRTIKLEEMRGGSFTISNVGAVGGVFATPIMNYPQAAILAIGKIREVPMVRSGKIEIGKEVPFSLTFDHRLIDGADAGRFVNKMTELLKEPETMLFL